MKKFYNPNHANLVEKIVASAVFRFSNYRYFAERMRYAGEIADFSVFLKSKFPILPPPRFRYTREAIWSDIENRLSNNVIFLEFGVASGYLTNWWMNSSIKDKNFNYHGFDSFQGLPASWRGFEKRTFTTQGKAPEISHDFLFWHIGLVEETLSNKVLKGILNSTYQLVIFFDLDLYGPTLYSYLKLRPYLKVGDIIYFDEARDADERRVLVENVIPDFELRPISVSYSNVAFEIVSKRSI